MASQLIPGDVHVSSTGSGLHIATLYGETMLCLFNEYAAVAQSSLTTPGEFDMKSLPVCKPESVSQTFKKWCEQKYNTVLPRIECNWHQTIIYDVSEIVGAKCTVVFREWPYAWVFCKVGTTVKFCGDRRELQDAIKKCRKDVRSANKPAVTVPSPARVNAANAANAAMSRSRPPSDDMLICESTRPLNASPDVSVSSRDDDYFVRVELYDGTRIVSTETFRRMGVPRVIPDFSCAIFDTLHKCYHPSKSIGRELGNMITKYNVAIPMENCGSFRTNDLVKVGMKRSSHKPFIGGKYIAYFVEDYIVRVENA